MLIGLAVLFVAGVPLIAEFDAEGAALAAVAADLVLTGVMLRAVRHVGDGRLGVEGAYLARYAGGAGCGRGVALAVLAVATGGDRGRGRRRRLHRPGVRPAPRALGARPP